MYSGVLASTVHWILICVLLCLIILNTDPYIFNVKATVVCWRLRVVLLGTAA